MSAYINIYLTPKTNPEQHLLLFNRCRNNALYEYLSENINIEYIHNGVIKYTDISSEEINKIINVIKDKICDMHKRLNVYQSQISSNKDFINDIIETKDFIDELNASLVEFYIILSILNDIETGISDFIKISCNIDC